MTFSLPALEFELSVVTLLAAFACCGATLLIVRMQLARHRRRVTDLEERLVTFVEASINVAHSVQQLQSPESALPRVEVHMPNRRWILQEASERLDAGERLSEVAEPLGLSREEVSLLRLRSG